MLWQQGGKMGELSYSWSVHFRQYFSNLHKGLKLLDCFSQRNLNIDKFELGNVWPTLAQNFLVTLPGGVA
jgi:hypothetical protein